MNHPRRIGPQPAPTPATLTQRGAARGIPADLLREASMRLAIMSLMAAALWILGTVLWHLTWFSFNPGQPWPGLRWPDAVAALSSLSSVAFFFYIRRRDREPVLLLRIGMFYMVATCLAIAFVLHWGVAIETVEPQISWIGVVLLMFAAIVPVAPREMLIASLMGASMSLVAMVATEANEVGLFTVLKNGMVMHYPDFLLVGVAVVISRVVTRLGQEVTKAREMGAYQLGDLIKRGGMGEIYKATHRMLARPAAIKLIRPEMLADSGMSSELAVVRFRREAEAAANLRCPHTVELFDFGVTEDNTLYFVMELLDGLDLETLVREHGPLPPARVIHILRQACESLEEAHSKGLIHRDIKPANIHLGRVGVRADFVKILDFGLVKSMKPGTQGDSLATALGLTPGTPAYMAPEMALGEDVDARSDLYALGCVAYYLLTGKLVFEAENALQMMAKHLRNAPVPPSLRAGLPVPAALEDVVLSCLAKKAADRPPSASALSHALASVRITQWSDEQSTNWWRTSQGEEPSDTAVATSRVEAGV